MIESPRESALLETDDLAIWLKDRRRRTLLDEPVREKLVAGATNRGRANDLGDEEVEKIERDPFLIAHALAGSATPCGRDGSVPPERIRANRHIPDVRRAPGVRRCNTFAFLRALDFTTRRNARWRACRPLGAMLRGPARRTAALDGGDRAMNTGFATAPGVVLDDRVIEPRGFHAGEVRRGEVYRIVDLEGSQVADFVCFNLARPEEKLSP